MRKVKNLLISKSQKWMPLSIPPCPSRGPLQNNIVNRVLSIPPPLDHQPRNLTTSTHHSGASASHSSPSSSTLFSSTDISEAPTPVKWVMVHFRFAWYEILLGLSFGVPIALFGVTYDYVEGNLVPVKLFQSNPHLFEVFNMLDALAFTASVAGFLLHTVHKRTSKYLAVFAFGCLMIAFYVFLWVLFPSYLKWVPCLLFSLISVVSLYVHFVKGGNHSLDEHHLNLGSV